MSIRHFILLCHLQRLKRHELAVLLSGSPDPHHQPRTPYVLLPFLARAMLQDASHLIETPRHAPSYASLRDATLP